MLALLDAGLFGPPHLNADLNRLLHFAITGRHEVLIEPFGAENVREWLERFDEAGEYREALEHSQQRTSLPIQLRTVRVREGRDQPHSENPPVLSPRTACVVLELAYSVFLENARRDAPFLKALGRPDQALEWDRLTAKEWLRPSHTGGLTEMLEILKENEATGKTSRQRTFFVFDSDAWASGCPSQKSKELKKACRRWYRNHHQLERRAPENYLDAVVLMRSLGKGSRDLSERIKAFEGMTAEQRRYFNMKKGFGGDAKDTGRPKRDREAAELLYQDLSSARRASLAEGFGPQIADCFAEPSMPFQPDPEIVEVLDQIFADC